MISHVISRRVSDVGFRDPDLLHGLLMLCEGKETPRSLSKVVGMGEPDVADMLNKARIGQMSRVPASMGSDREVKGEKLVGLFPRQYRRNLIAMMLRPDGVDSPEVEAICGAGGWFAAPAAAVYELRSELKEIGVSVKSKAVSGTPFFRYRIIGNDALRMQKIIANGWAL